MSTPPPSTVNPSRRRFLRRLAWSGLGVAAAGLAYPTLWEPRRLRITRHRVPWRGLPPSFEGFRIVQLTDLHASRHVSTDYLQKCVETATALAPDLLVLTGDYVSSSHNLRGTFFYGRRQETRGHLEQCAARLAGARARHGVVAVLGNHDHWFDPDQVTAALQGAGVRVLRNEAVMIERGNEALPVVGLEDLWSGRMDPPRALRGLAPTASGVLVLMHNPDPFATWSIPGEYLFLVGHTHGGQVNLPLLGPPLVPSQYGARYAQGWFQRGSTRMYVSAGVGMIFPPVRLNCRPEIAVFELEKA